MPGTILENLSGRKLGVLVGVLLCCQLGCFLVGLIAPSPATSDATLATVCIDKDAPEDNANRWLSRECHPSINLNQDEALLGYSARDLVFTMEAPLNSQYDFSRWQQYLVGILQVDTVYKEGHDLLESPVELTLEAQLAYSNKLGNGKRTPWKLFAKSEETRFMDCHLDEPKKSHGQPYNCSMVPIFELGTLFHDYYLLNLRLPSGGSKNSKIGNVVDITLHVIHMNGGFTRIWMALKTIFFPIILGIMWWFWRRVHILSRTPALLEYMLMALGSTLALLNLPLEYLTLYFNMPFMLLLSDIRQGVFYAMLLSFWLVFAGEHMLIQDKGEKNHLKMYWKHLSTIVIGCLSLLIFDLCERGVQLVNPFYSIWVTPLGTNLALSFIILAGISACIYFLFLCYMIWNVFRNISIKRLVLPNMSQARRLHYEGIIYRFNFLMLTTVVCAGLTVISFILSQVAEGQNKWDENMDLELSSALHTGVYGMWNVYICAMLILYAPSHKQWPSSTLNSAEGEEVEFSRMTSEVVTPNEISSLTSFASKASIE